VIDFDVAFRRAISSVTRRHS